MIYKFKYSFILYIFCTFFLTTNTFAQILTIKDLKTNEPLELVTLISLNPIANSTSNSKGQVNISEYKKATKIEFSCIGYKSKTVSFDDIVKANFVLFLTPSVLKMDEIVISATKWSQHSDDIPSKIISISNKNILIQNPQTTADLLSLSGKVFIQKSQQGGGSPMIRGFATNRLLYSVDGVRMNTAIFRSGNIQNVISLDPFAMEKTEIFFGPGSVIYGSDAIGGVMSFQTLTPQFSMNDEVLINGKVVSRFSSANLEKTGHFDVNIGWEKWALTSSLSYFDFDNLLMGSHGPEEYLKPFFVIRQNGVDIVQTNENPKVQKPSAYSQLNLMQKIHFKSTENWDFQYGFHFSETSEYGRYDRHIRLKNGLPRYGEWNYGPQKWMMNYFSLLQKSQHFLFEQLNLRLAHQYFEESRISRDINKPNQETRTEKINAYSINVDLLKTLSLKSEIYYGLEWVLNDVNSTGIDTNIVTGTSQVGPARYPLSTWSSMGAYLTNQYKISDALNIQAGLRYNRYLLNATFDTTFYPFPYTQAQMDKGSLTGSLGFVWKPENDLSISANAATAFRSPNVDDMGKVFDSANGIVLVPNPDLAAEYAYNFDFGIAKMFHNKIKFDLTSYYTYLDNAMVRRDFQLNGHDYFLYDGELSKVQAIQNAAKTTIIGLQVGVEIKLPDGFGFSTDYNIQKGLEELDNGETSPSRHAPPSYGISKLTFSAQKLNMQLYTVYSGQKDFNELPSEEQDKPEIYAIDINGKPYSPGWYTLNFKASYQFTNNLSVSSGIENLTDQRYKPYSSGIAAAGRNFILSLKANI